MHSVCPYTYIYSYLGNVHLILFKLLKQLLRHGIVTKIFQIAHPNVDNSRELYTVVNGRFLDVDTDTGDEFG